MLPIFGNIFIFLTLRFMKVATELPNVETLQHLGNAALYLITQLPEEERSQPHETAKGETKTPDETINT